MNITTQLQQSLERETEIYWHNVELLAERFHCEVLTPYCRKHQLDFQSGNGSWDFAKGPRTGLRISVDESKLSKSIIKMLKTKLANPDHDFGMYVADVRQAWR